MMELEKSIKSIQVLAQGIVSHIENLGLDTNKNILDYKLDNLLNIDTAVRQCERCGKTFAPRLGMIGLQIYCGDDCRYNSTTETRKQIRQEPRYHEIDKLRKLIYERKYRANRDNRPLTEERQVAYEQILTDLKALTSRRKYLTDKEFSMQLAQIKSNYYRV